MTAFVSEIINKYHGVASKQVIHAVENAAAKTGADFSYLMEKASTESSFNPAAKSKSSSATGLFQFIESTWLSVVKEHGAKYGLGKLAAQIETKDGKPCVHNCDVKKAILNLRKNPEIAALMAGELSEGNKQYLEGRTKGDVGTTELYLAHFMGAGGAAKFLNSRENNGDAVAAKLFPREAHANKGVFFSAGGKPRTLNDIYDFFAKKFDGGTSLQSAPSPSPAEYVSTPSAPAQYHTIASPAIAQALFSSIPMNSLHAVSESTRENDNGAIRSGFSRAHKISADNILLMAQMQKRQHPFFAERPQYNS